MNSLFDMGRAECANKIFRAYLPVGRAIRPVSGSDEVGSRSGSTVGTKMGPRL
jgi:hypothetical protein